MNCEKDRRESARPELVCEAIQQQKEKDGVQGVEKKAHQVMTLRVQAKELHIEHVQEPCDRMPIRPNPMQIEKGPFYRVNRDTLLDIRIGGDVIGVIVVDEIASHDPAKRKQRKRSD